DKAAGVMERRSDPYPDSSNTTALVGQLASLLGLNGGNLGGLFGGQQSKGGGNNKFRSATQVPQFDGYTYDSKAGKYKPTADTIYARQAAQRSADNAAGSMNS